MLGRGMSPWWKAGFRASVRAAGSRASYGVTLPPGQAGLFARVVCAGQQPGLDQVADSAALVPCGEDGDVTFPWLEAPYTTTLSPAPIPAPLPIFRILNWDGELLPGVAEPDVDRETQIKLHREMIRLRVIDTVMNQAQRINLISFYMTSFGEEAIHFGTVGALRPDDEIFAQYREQGVLLWRGFTIRDMCDQCVSNHLETGKGRQMPVHYAGIDYHAQTISSPLATQLPQSVGYAYALKQQGSPRIAVTYFGEGAFSEGDSPSALNFAGVLRAPVLFVCRNNGYAISTRATEQYAGDGVASRGVAFGLETYRVDGNDLLAVYTCTRLVRERMAKDPQPIMIEFLSYRLGHHSTSDDSTSYRPKDEIEYWRMKADPIVRYQRYLEKKGWWSQSEHDELTRETTREVRQSLNAASKVPFAKPSDMFVDVYDQVPSHIAEQQQECKEHMDHYGQHYPLDKFLPESA